MPTFWTVNKKLLAQNKKKEKNGGQILNEGKLQIVRLFMKYQFIFLISYTLTVETLLENVLCGRKYGGGYDFQIKYQVTLDDVKNQVYSFRLKIVT